MHTRSRPLLGIATLVTVALVALFAGCTKPDSTDRPRGDAAGPTRTAAATPRSDKRGVEITTTDGGVTLGLTGDSVWMRLSDKVLDEARRDMAKDKRDADSSALGSSIERMVKSTVTSALNTRIAYPLEDIEDVRYEKGAIKFDYRRRNRVFSFENIKSNNVPALRTFSAADAERFVAAVRAAKGKT